MFFFIVGRFLKNGRNLFEAFFFAPMRNKYIYSVACDSPTKALAGIFDCVLVPIVFDLIIYINYYFSKYLFLQSIENLQKYSLQCLA